MTAAGAVQFKFCNPARGGLDDFCPAESRERVVVCHCSSRPVRSLRSCHSSLCPKIRSPLFGLSCCLASAERLRLALQGQRLPTDERSRCSDLAASLILAGHVSHHAELASRKNQQGFGGCRGWRQQWTGGYHA